jgi:hypothetical protein
LMVQALFHVEYFPSADCIRSLHFFLLRVFEKLIESIVLLFFAAILPLVQQIFKDHSIIFARSAIYPLFPYKYLLFSAHSIFIVSGNSHAIIKENLKCDKCFLYDRIRS